MNASAGARVSLIGWYSSSTNQVEVALMQDKQKLQITQTAFGLKAQKSVAFSILANTDYDVKTTFDGTEFHVFVNGVDKLSLLSIGSPAGNLKLRVKSGSKKKVTGKFQSVAVYEQ